MLHYHNSNMLSQHAGGSDRLNDVVWSKQYNDLCSLIRPSLHMGTCIGEQAPGVGINDQASELLMHCCRIGPNRDIVSGQDLTWDRPAILTSMGGLTCTNVISTAQMAAVDQGLFAQVCPACLIPAMLQNLLDSLYVVIRLRHTF